jgi:hypothetical protein
VYILRYVDTYKFVFFLSLLGYLEQEDDKLVQAAGASSLDEAVVNPTIEVIVNPDEEAEGSGFNIPTN